MRFLLIRVLILMNKSFIFFLAIAFAIYLSLAQGNGLAAQPALVMNDSDLDGLTPSKALAKRGEYKLAFEKARSVIEEEFSYKLVDDFIQFSYDVLQEVKKEVKIKEQPILFLPKHKKRREITYNDGEKVWVKVIKIILIPEWEVVPKWITHEEESKTVTLPDEREVAKYIEGYDAIRDACLLLEKMLGSIVKKEPNESNMNYLYRTRSLIQQLKEDRTSYLSYNVISPHLCEAHRMAYNAKPYIGNTEEKEIQEAAKIVARGLHKDWIYQSSDRVRDQYIDVIKYLKNSVSGDVWEEILAVTTLSDSLSPDKKRGGEAWLSEGKAKR